MSAFYSKIKVAGRSPVWEPFPGFSILFDNPGKALAREGRYDFLSCDLESEGLGFFGALRDAIEREQVAADLDGATFCPLPPESYHVTVLDGANASNFHLFGPVEQEVMRALASGVFDGNPAAEEIEAWGLLRRTWDLELRFLRVSNWSNVSLVAELEPADPPLWNEFSAARAEAIEGFARRFGVRIAGEALAPHVTLGYFADANHADIAASCVLEMNQRLGAALSGQRIRFKRASLYAFRDMAKFFKRHDP